MKSFKSFAIVGLAAAALLVGSAARSAMAQSATVTATTTTVTLPTLQQLLANPSLLFSSITPKLIADLTAAKADAAAQTPPDTDSVNCYGFILTLVNSPIVNPLPTTNGIFSAIQKGRDDSAAVNNLNSTTGPFAQLNSACAAWSNDNKATLAMVAAKLGVVAGAAGLKLTLGGLAL
jgi:hypothetical protein